MRSAVTTDFQTKQQHLKDGILKKLEVPKTVLSQRIRDFKVVPVTGLEPVRILLRGILSPLCLPNSTTPAGMRFLEKNEMFLRMFLREFGVTFGVTSRKKF